ncbi:hypothetical protein [Nostoc sp. WHI]|uniref:hypothetical protein n=1 Tax=Nostoc sp. WHI TaxID=2650611 RepID=UPI0018C4C0F1|nr:hypothetical protein [Nostoc sp. WHI]MBG1267855.1 hypothetical protein [Nostoc sp. WHI]
MRPLISEFSYGYALTEQLVSLNRSRIKVAPVFPSLYKEGKDGYGYDVSIQWSSIPVFLQFKLSDYMTGRSNSEEIKQGLFKGSFYRMHLRSRKHSKQHDLLLELENKKTHVYYVTPLFYKLEELNHYYANNQILENSTFITPHSIGMIKDDDNHHISFQEPGKPFYIFSEPRQLGILPSFQVLFERTNLIREGGYSGDIWEDTFENMLEILPNYRIVNEEDIVFLRETISNKTSIEKLAYLAQAFFYCQLFIVS